MYRTAASRKPPDTEVLCRACAIRTNVNLEEARSELFTCEACGREQPVLRDKGDDEIEAQAIASVDAGAYDDLSPLMVALGTEGKVTQLTLACDGIKIQVALSINSGTVVGLDMVAHAPGLFAARFLREDSGHKKAKEKGISREAQTGDASFDEEVYVETTMSDDAVRTVLAASAVRHAIQELVADVGVVQINGGNVSIYVKKDNNAFSPGAISRRLGLLRMIAGAPRPLGAIELPKPLASTLTMMFAYVFTPLSILLLFFIATMYTPIDDAPYAIGAVSGLMVVPPLWLFYNRMLRGRSTSHRDLRIARVGSIVACPVFMTGVLLHINALGREAGKTVDLKVTSTSIDDDDKSTLHVEARDVEGRTHRYSFNSSVTEQKPKIVRVTWHRGSLGWTFEGPTRFLYYDDPPPR